MGRHSVKKSAVQLFIDDVIKPNSEAVKKMALSAALLPALAVTGTASLPQEDTPVVTYEEHSAEDVAIPQNSFTVSESTGSENVLDSMSASFDGVSAKKAPEEKKEEDKFPESDAEKRADASSAGTYDAESVYSPIKRAISYKECNTSSSIESGLTAPAVNVYRAVCAEFPGVASAYGGRRVDPGSDHNSGNAVDVMVRGKDGDDMMEFLLENRSELRIKYLIWEQKIYGPWTDWKGRPMEDRGGDTANHFDHVHISVK